MSQEKCDPNQIERFQKLARELECDEDEGAFKEKLKHVLQHKPKGDDSKEK